MPKKVSIVKSNIIGTVDVPKVEVVVEAKVIKVPLLTQEFSNGDMNTLRDKINEIIKGL